MNKESDNRLCLDDFRLFQKGGCHIFATVLSGELSSQRATIVRVEVTRHDAPPLHAYHVLVREDEFVADICGIRRTEDYLDWIREHKKEIWCEGTVYYPTISLIPVTPDELKESTKEKDGDDLNQWNLCVTQEFVAQCEIRAKKLIQDYASIFSFEVLRQGRLYREK